MSPKPLEITERELAVLDVLWNRKRATIREITDALYTRRTTGEYATVQKLLERLEAKGCVRRDRSSFAHVFSAKISREKLIGQGLETLAEKLCAGSLTPLLMHLVEKGRLSEDQRRQLRELIDQSDAGGGKRKGRK